MNRSKIIDAIVFLKCYLKPIKESPGFPTDPIVKKTVDRVEEAILELQAEAGLDV